MKNIKKLGKSISRRSFLKILGVTGAAATVAPRQVKAADLYPYIIQKKGVIPGKSYYYNSVSRMATGVLPITVRSREARVTKIEGNAKYGPTKGGLDSVGQALLHLHYHPDRIAAPYSNEASGPVYLKWADAEDALAAQVKKLVEAGRGSRIRFVGPAETSSLGKLIDSFLDSVGAPARVVYEPLASEQLLAGNLLSFNAEEAPTYRFEKADYVLSFGADFLDSFGDNVSYSVAFAKARSGKDGQPNADTCPFVYVGARQSVTGMNADAYFAVPVGKELDVALAMITVILSEGIQRNGSPAELAAIKNLAAAYTPAAVAEVTGLDEQLLIKVARNFAKAGAPLAVAGGASTQSATGTQLVVAANLLNYVTGAVNNTLTFGAKPTWATPRSYENMLALVADMKAGNVDLLLTWDTNPAYHLPKAVGFAEAAANVAFKVHFTVLPDETAALANLVFPVHTTLEDWGDYRTQNGTWFLYQPCMEPILEAFHRLKQKEFTLPTGERPQSKGFGDILLSTAKLVGGRTAGALNQPTFGDYVKEQWRSLQGQLAPGKSFDAFFEEALQNGGYWTEAPVTTVSLRGDLSVDFGKPTPATGEKLMLFPHPILLDGRGANIPLLQEMPDPITSITWGTWAEFNDKAKVVEDFRFGLQADLTTVSGHATYPTMSYPAMHPSTVAIPLGNGRSVVTPYVQKLADDKLVGLNALDLIPGDVDPLSGGLILAGIEVGAKRVSKRIEMAATSGSFDQINRGLARAISPGGVELGYAPKDEKLLKSVDRQGWHKESHFDQKAPAAAPAEVHPTPAPEAPAAHDGAHAAPALLKKAVSATVVAAVNHGNGHAASNGHGAAHGAEAAHEAGHGAAAGHGAGNGGGHHSSYTTFYKKQQYPTYQWGIAIDLDKCNGCGACVTACHTENNVPVVGRVGLINGREMSWLRFERFEVDTGEATPKSLFTLMLCQQCEAAPCEPVCPAFAAYHNDEGLNVQVYNRCIGTRYCANNCPYKVRRFNFFNYKYPDFLAISYNPDIWVRPQGVMEKCTFCIQRIRAGKDVAKDEKRLVKDGEITPACAQTCPTGAITFGNLKDPESAVSKLSKSDRAYRALNETQGTEPSVFYLRRVIRNV